MNRNVVTMAIGVILCCTVTPVHAQFSDVQPSLAQAEGIAYVFSRGIVQGYPDGTFRPESHINRAEFAKIASLFYWEGEARYIEMCNSAHFDDVPKGTWFFHYVCSAKDHGIVEGYPGTRIYAPEQSISVAEAAKMIIKSFKMQYTTSEAEPWYTPYIRILAARKALPESLPALDQPITRGDVAEIFYRLGAENMDKPSLTYTQLTGEADRSNDPCLASPTETAIGRMQNPISDRYANLPHLGPLFTAADCGESRLKELYGNLTAAISDVRIVLKQAPSLDLYNELYAVGFAPTEAPNTIESREWILTYPVSFNELLGLKAFANEFWYDDCVYCG